MKEAFETLTDTMDKKGNAKLLTNGKFSQTFQEAAEALRQAPDLGATEYNTNVAEKVKKKLAAAIKDVTPEKVISSMKDMVEICSNFLAQNAEFNKQKGPAFKNLVNALRNKPTDKLYQKGKIHKMNEQAAAMLEEAKGFDVDHDDPNLSQEIHSAMTKLVSNSTPDALKKEMAETVDSCSKYLSQKTVDELERGPAFDAMVKELDKYGGEPFSDYPALSTKHAAAYTLSSAPGLASVLPDPVTAPEFKAALHKVVDPITSKEMQPEMNDVVNRSANYLSAFIRDRGPAMDALLEMMKSKPANVFAKRNDYTMDYKTAAEETETAPTLVPFLPVKDIADEGKANLTKDMKDVTPPALIVPMKTLIEDVSKHLSQPVAMQSGAAGGRYAMNLLGAVKKTLGSRPLFKYKSYGQTYSDASDVLKHAGPIESAVNLVSRMNLQSQQTLTSKQNLLSKQKLLSKQDLVSKEEPRKSNINLRHEIASEMNRGVPTQLAPTIAEGLKPTINKAAKHLANIGTEKGKALNHLVNLMKEKGESPLGKLQGYEQTYSDAARRLENAPSLANDKVDKKAYESVKTQLTALAKEKPDKKHEGHLPGVIDESSKFLAAPLPETAAEKRGVLSDLMGRKENKILAEDGIYKMTYKEGGEEMKKAPVGVTKSQDEEKKMEMVKNIEAILPDKKMVALLKEPTKEGAAHLTDVVKGRGEAMEIIHESLKKAKEKEFIEVGNFKQTHEDAADMLAKAPNFSGEEPSPVIMEKVEHQVAELPKNVPPGKTMAKEHMEDASKIASKYIASKATNESGLDSQELTKLDKAGFNADAKAAAEARRLAAVEGGASTKVTKEGDQGAGTKGTSAGGAGAEKRAGGKGAGGVSADVKSAGGKAAGVVGTDGKVAGPVGSDEKVAGGVDADGKDVGIEGRDKKDGGILGAVKNIFGGMSAHKKTADGKAVGADGKAAGIVAADGKAAGVVGADEKAAGVVGADVKAAGVVAADRKAAGVVVADEKAAGVVRADGKAAGVIGADGKAVGVVAADRKAAGIVGADEKAAGVVSADGKAAGVVGADGKAAGVVAADGKAAGVVGADEKAAGVVAADGKAAGVVGADGKAAGVEGADGKAAGVVGADEKAAGVVGADGKAAGIVAVDEKATDVMGTDGKAAGVVGADEKAAGVVGADGKAAGLVGADGKAAGVVATDERAAGAVDADGKVADVVGADGKAAGVVGADGKAAGVVGADGKAAGVLDAYGKAAGVVGADGKAAGVLDAYGKAAGVVGADGQIARGVGTDGKASEGEGADAKTDRGVGAGGAGRRDIGSAADPGATKYGPGGGGYGPEGGPGYFMYSPAEADINYGPGGETPEQRRRRLAEAEAFRTYEEGERKRLGDKEYFRRLAERKKLELEAGGPGGRKYRGAALGADFDPEHEAALDILHNVLRTHGDELFYQQPQTNLTHDQASNWLAMPYPIRVDKTVRESGDTARLYKRFERKLSALVSSVTPPDLYDIMQDVVIESARRLSEFFVSTNYKILVREALISEMQKRGNEILTEVDGAAETFFFAAQRLKRPKSMEAQESCYQVAHHVSKKLDDIIRSRSMARKLTATMKDHIKDSANYLSAMVTKPDDQIEAYIALLGEMEAAGDTTLINGDIVKSYKEAAAYLRQLTSYEDQIGRPNSSLQAAIESKLKSLMENVTPNGYSHRVMDTVITESAGLLVSYIMLQGEKTEALKVLIREIGQAGDGVLLRHGPLRKSFKEGADLLRGTNTDQLCEPSADPVVTRKIQLKLNKLMLDKTPEHFQALMDDVIEDATVYMAVHFLEPQPVIQVCKCMKNVFVQCELWCDEILRRVARPSCSCSRHVSAQALQDVAPMQRLRVSPSNSHVYAPGLEIAIKSCPTKQARLARQRERPKPQGECPAANPTPGCQQGPTTSYLLHSTSYKRFGYDSMRLSPSSSSNSQHNSPFSSSSPIQPSKRTSPVISLLNDIHSDNMQYFQQGEQLQSLEMENQGVLEEASASFHNPATVNKSGTTQETKTSYPFPRNTTTPTLIPNVQMPETSKISQSKSGYSSRTPIISTEQMADWHEVMASLMWNVQAWRDWIQEIFDRTLGNQHNSNVTREETNDSWSTFHMRVSTEALQWRQYSAFSRQLTARLALRYKDKEITSPIRATVSTKTYLECQEEMLEICYMFNRWTQWLTLVVKETDSLQQIADSDIPLHVLRWNHFKKKGEGYSKDWVKYNTHLKVTWEQKYGLLFAEYLPSWKEPGPVWVVNTCGAVPSGAVAAGDHDGEVIWVARTTHRCNVLPAALYPSKHCCLVYAEGAVHRYTKYQVMCNAEVRWVAWRGGSVGGRAVRVAAGVHVGRVHYRGDHLLGAVHAPHFRCHVVIFGRPFAFNCYELLMLAGPDDHDK